MKLVSFTLGAALALALSVPALAQDTVTIGFTVSQTGKLNNDATSQLRGIELWRDDVNAAGGIKAGDKTYKVNLVTYDDESQNTRVQQLYTRLISQDKAQFLFSPYSSGLVATAAIREDLQAGEQESVPAVFGSGRIPRRRREGAEGEEPEGKRCVRL
jgi:ABC-type branched-subunit amino acid transport system substrate-binding protein